MTTRTCLPWPDKRLRTAATEVSEITDEIRAIWDDMIDTMEAMPGVGLAAPTPKFCTLQSSCVNTKKPARTSQVSQQKSNAPARSQCGSSMRMA